MTFADTWLPNIVCTFGGIIVSGLIGYWLGRKPTRIAEKQLRIVTQLILKEEEDGRLKLVRDKDGNITGGRAYEAKLEAGYFGSAKPPTKPL
jgi:hypothetical protein